METIDTAAYAAGYRYIADQLDAGDALTIGIVTAGEAGMQPGGIPGYPRWHAAGDDYRPAFKIGDKVLVGPAENRKDWHGVERWFGRTGTVRAYQGRGVYKIEFEPHSLCESLAAFFRTRQVLEENLTAAQP